MDTQERNLRRKLNRNGYTLRKKDSGYQIGDKDTNTVYLGLECNATLDEVIRFADNIDETGYSDTNPYADGNEDVLHAEYLESLHMEISNLARHLDTLLLEGKHTQAEELNEKIMELEELLAEEEELDELERNVRGFLETKGYRLEKGIYGYRISEVGTGGAVQLGEQYDAKIEDVTEFAGTLGMR